MEPTPDLQLVEGCLTGNETAWREIVMRYQKLVYNIAYRFTGRFDRAEDLTQEVFIKVHRSMGKFHQERGELRSWITVMARNHLIDHVRKEKKGWTQSGGSEELDRLDYKPAEAGPERQLEKQEQIRFVHDCLRELTPDLRTAMVMRDIEGLSYEEVATALRVPLGTVKSRINRARIDLARIMNMRRLKLFPDKNVIHVEGSENELPRV